MATIFRRTLATLSSSAPASSSATTSASRSTTPQAVRARLAAFPSSPTITRKLTPAQERRFQEAFDLGELKDDEGAEIVDEKTARNTWLKNHDEWRSRIRGHTQVLNMPTQPRATGETLSSQTTLTPFSDTPTASSLAAHRIYLPNIQIRLMRNHTPVGEPYDPYIATFRIPNSMTKTDLRSYLFAVYGLQVTFIRTDNYIGEIKRIGPAGQNKRVSCSSKT